MGTPEIVNSGTCASKGLLTISSKNECEDAAWNSGTKKLASKGNWQILATGSVVADGWLGFNTNNNDVTCDQVIKKFSSSNENTYNCLCKAGKFNHFCT